MVLSSVYFICSLPENGESHKKQSPLSYCSLWFGKLLKIEMVARKTANIRRVMLSWLSSKQQISLGVFSCWLASSTLIPVLPKTRLRPALPDYCFPYGRRTGGRPLEHHAWRCPQFCGAVARSTLTGKVRSGITKRNTNLLNINFLNILYL